MADPERASGVFFPPPSWLAYKIRTNVEALATAIIATGRSGPERI